MLSDTSFIPVYFFSFGGWSRKDMRDVSQIYSKGKETKVENSNISVSNVKG